MFKKSKKVLVVFSLLIVSIFSSTGCSKQQSSILSLGQWLGMINGAFGMESYVQKEPYISSVDAGNDYFNTVQIAAEWEVIDRDSSINPEDELLWKDALITLVNAGNFTSSDASEEEKLDYAMTHFDTNIRDYWMDRPIDVTSATSLLMEAQNQWANKTYDEAIEKVEYNDNVLNLGDVDAGDYQINQDGNITIDAETAKDIAKDDVIVLPNNDNNSDYQAYKVDDIKIEDDVAVIQTNDDLELGDYVDELYIQETETPDFSQATIYDGNGNLLQAGTSTATNQSKKTSDEFIVNSLETKRNNGVNAKPLGTGSFEFEVDGCKVTLKIMSNGLSGNVEMPLSKDKKVKGYCEVELSNFTVTKQIDYKWFKLDSAQIKAEYQLKQKFGVKKEFKDSNYSYNEKWTHGDKNFFSKLKNIWKEREPNEGKKIKIGTIVVASAGVASFSVDVYATLKVDGSIEISCNEHGCKGIEYKNGNCRVINISEKSQDTQIKCEVEGTVAVAPVLNVCGQDIIGLKAEAGIGAAAGMTVRLADNENHLLTENKLNDLTPEAVGANKATGLTANKEEIQKLAEEQGGVYDSTADVVDLHYDTCIDINVYFILRIGLEKDTLAGKLLKATNVKVEWEIFGDDNGKLANLHVENFDFMKAFSNMKFFTDEDQCTMQYVPFDKAKEEEKEEEPKDEKEPENEEDTNDDGDTDDTDVPENTPDDNTNEVKVGEVLSISEIRLFMEKDSTKKIAVTQIPKNYSKDDLVFESLDSSIVTVSEDGLVKAVKEGRTTVIVKTKDGKYSCACAISVIEEMTTDFTPLKV